MIATDVDAPAWVFVSCFGLSIASALLPWLNGEAIVLSFAALLRSPLDLAVLTLVAAAGQLLGKCVLFRAATAATFLRGCGSGRRLERLEWLRHGGVRAMSVVFVSSLVGLPPLYLTTLAAGAVGMAFKPFVGAAAAGRVLRFAAVAFAPRIVMGVAGG